MTGEKTNESGGRIVFLDDAANSRARFLPWVEMALCIALAWLLFVKGIRPAWRVLNTDFPNYYLVARLLREGFSLDRIYDWVWLQRIKDHWGLDQSLVGFGGLTPFSALPVVPLTVFSALTAKRIWIVANLAFLWSSVELLHRSTTLGRRRIWLLTMLAVIPLRTSFLYGQMHLLVLLLMVLAYFFHARNREIFCGVCIALAGALKIYPLLFGIYLLWKRQWRAPAAMLAAAIVIAIATGAWMGGDLLRVYATQIMPRSLQGEVLDPYHWHAASGAAFLHRLLLYEPALNPAPLFNSPSLYAVLYPAWQMAVLVPLFALIRPGKKCEQLEWAGFLLALLLLSPVPSSYHFVVIILPVVLLVDTLHRHHDRRIAIAAIALYTFMSVVGLWKSPINPGPAFIGVIGFARLWLGIMLYAVIVFCLWRDRPTSDTEKSSRRLVLVAGLSLCAFVLSVNAYRHHFANREQQMSRRLSPPSPAYLATEPFPLADSYLYVAMTQTGYRVLDRQGGEVAPYARSRRYYDQLSYAVAPDNSIVLELSDATGSRIVRASDRAVLAEDAESPVLSPDGRTLVFVREHEGRGSLWLVPLDATGAPTASPKLLTSEEYDVRTAAVLRSGSVAFIAKHDNRVGLFLLAPNAAPSRLVPLDDELAAFSFSPDETHVAVSRLLRNRWQLVTVDLTSSQENVLTAGDCNAYSPAWIGSSVMYATDCGRGLALTALAAVDVNATSFHQP